MTCSSFFFLSEKRACCWCDCPCSFDPLLNMRSWQVGEPKFVFEAKTIQRMELLVLSTLGWRMLAFTPCSFIDYFLGKIINVHQSTTLLFISRSVQLILSTIKGLFLTVFTVFISGCSGGLMVLMQCWVGIECRY